MVEIRIIGILAHSGNQTTKKCQTEIFQYLYMARGAQDHRIPVHHASHILQCPLCYLEPRYNSGHLLCPSKESQSTNHGGIDVSSWFRLLVVVPVIGEAIVAIRATQHSSYKNIRIRRAWIQVLKSVIARDMARVGLHRGNWRATMVNMQWIPLPESNHIWHLCRILAQYVINLVFQKSSKRSAHASWHSDKFRIGKGLFGKKKKKSRVEKKFKWWEVISQKI